MKLVSHSGTLPLRNQVSACRDVIFAQNLSACSASASSLSLWGSAQAMAASLIHLRPLASSFRRNSIISLEIKEPASSGRQFRPSMLSTNLSLEGSSKQDENDFRRTTSLGSARRDRPIKTRPFYNHDRLPEKGNNKPHQSEWFITHQQIAAELRRRSLLRPFRHMFVEGTQG